MAEAGQNRRARTMPGVSQPCAFKTMIIRPADYWDKAGLLLARLVSRSSGVREACVRARHVIRISSIKCHNVGNASCVGHGFGII